MAYYKIDDIPKIYESSHRQKKRGFGVTLYALIAVFIFSSVIFLAF